MVQHKSQLLGRQAGAALDEKTRAWVTSASARAARSLFVSCISSAVATVCSTRWYRQHANLAASCRRASNGLLLLCVSAVSETAAADDSASDSAPLCCPVMVASEGHDPAYVRSKTSGGDEYAEADENIVEEEEDEAEDENDGGESDEVERKPFSKLELMDFPTPEARWNIRLDERGRASFGSLLSSGGGGVAAAFDSAGGSPEFSSCSGSTGTTQVLLLSPVIGVVAWFAGVVPPLSSLLPPSNPLCPPSWLLLVGDSLRDGFFSAALRTGCSAL